MTAWGMQEGSLRGCGLLVEKENSLLDSRAGKSKYMLGRNQPTLLFTAFIKKTKSD
jgi:hypothetical protein